MSRGTTSVAGLTAFALLFAAFARADEIKLKDGSKITGTIVGFEDNSFKVKTSYGFAVVQKDQVVSITVTGDAKQPEPDSVKKPDSDAGKKPESAIAKKSDVAAVKKSESAAAKTPVTAPAPAAAKPEKVEHTSAPPTTQRRRQLRCKLKLRNRVLDLRRQFRRRVSAHGHSDFVGEEFCAACGNFVERANISGSSCASAKPAAPEPMREEVSGNLYTNDTYGFRMYKPPTWKLIEGARTILPGSITALGTDDQNTYLLIGQEPSGKSLANDIAATEQRLHEIMENFRPLGEKQVMISGVSATERRFRGSVDSRDWSGVVVYIPRGTRVYTIFGMTLADTDLVQIQENVISRAITSLQFTK